jgi:hypothetical protein
MSKLGKDWMVQSLHPCGNIQGCSKKQILMRLQLEYT